MSAQGDRLAAVWGTPSTLRGFLGAVNHKQLGLRFVVTAFGFFCIAGIDSLVLRSQLATPDLQLVSPDRFNQLFTTHGSAMMFLFAVPMVEGIAIFLVPLMIGARDVVFPRMTAFGYWLYLFAGLLLYGSTLPDIVNFVWPGQAPLPNIVPDGGWFAYPPLTGPEYSPGIRMDIWLMAVTLAEISAVTAAIELIATIFKARAPGMTVSRMPIFVWSVLVMSFAILFAFPAVILASTFLELWRLVGMPFYDPAAGGDPILWQHLFWIFGHPEVYIMFIPATGIASMVIPAFTGRPIVGYTWVVAALIGTAFLSFGLWVHHMFAVGLPWLGLAYFSAASMLITFPSGVQVFAWLATLLRGRRLALTTAHLYALGFIVIFVLGGITGVMVASVPFDLQVHDTYFVVAHFHYVLVGGVVFPIFAGLYYWFPKATGWRLNERFGRIGFWLFFIGFNVAFLPQHMTGLLGMRRRVYTYLDDPALVLWNVVSTIGTFVMAIAVLLIVWNVAEALWRRRAAVADPWDGGTLEWSVASPPPTYNFRTIPDVRAREPVREQHEIPAAVEGNWREPPPNVALWRETLGTSVLEATPTCAIRLPGNTLLPLGLAAALLIFVMGLLAKVYLIAGVGALAAVAAAVVWTWPDAEERSVRRSGPTLRGDVSALALGADSTLWWGAVLTIAALGALFASTAFSYLYLAYGSDQWPPNGAAVPGPLLPALGASAVVLAAAATFVADRAAAAGDVARTAVGLGVAVALGVAGLATGAAGQLTSGIDPTATAYGAIHHFLSAFWLALVVASVASSAIALAEALRGYVDAERRGAVEVSALLWYFTAVAALVAVALTTLAPRLMG